MSFMTTDYNFPRWFWDPETTDEDRHVWMTQERCRRQAMRQQTAYAERVRAHTERLERRQQARPDTVDVTDYC